MKSYHSQVASRLTVYEYVWPCLFIRGCLFVYVFVCEFVYKCVHILYVCVCFECVFGVDVEVLCVCVCESFCMCACIYLYGFVCERKCVCEYLFWRVFSYMCFLYEATLSDSSLCADMSRAKNVWRCEWRWQLRVRRYLNVCIDLTSDEIDVDATIEHQDHDKAKGKHDTIRA